MKASTRFLPGTAAAAATALFLTVQAQAAPKKPEPAPATEQQPATKKSSSAKVKPSAGTAKEEPQPAQAPQSAKAKGKPVTKTAAPPVDLQPEKKKGSVTKKKAEEQAPASGNKIAKAKVDTPPETAPAPPPEKKGFLKGLFGGRKKAEEPREEPALAKAKTAKPVPVKDLKPVKPAPVVPTAPVAAVEEPKKKRGLFGFLRGNKSDDSADATVPDAEKIERPADWKDHRVVKEETVALYEFGPSQSNGPDARLDRGTVVKLKRVEKGWALVQTNSGRAGYIDAAALRDALETDFAAPVVVRSMATASVSPEAWAPAAPPPDLPDRPASLDTESGLLLLPPLESGPKKQ
jgi:hypothetical protein